MIKRKKRQKTENKKKSFYFEDYKDSEGIIKNEKSIVDKISPDRVTFIFFIFFILIFIFCIKITYLSFSKENLLTFKKNISKEREIKRHDIIDRNNIILARNINGYSAGIRPKLIKNKKKLMLNLKLIFPEIELKKIESKINNNKFFYIKKRLVEEDELQLRMLGNKAIQLDNTQFRIYPQKNLFSHVIGQVDENNYGVSGVEKFFDKNLKNNKLENSPLNLTLDSNLQFIIRDELLKAQKNFKAIGSAAILMDIDNGEILSLLSLPDYDLNQRKTIDEKIYLNKITNGVYEMGSVFKLFTIAAGLENKVIEKNSIFNNLENSIRCDKYTISEHDELPSNLTVEQILVMSSNIGAVRIAQKIGIEEYKNFLNSLKLFEKIDFEFQEIGTPLPFKWGKCKLATASYGHGITTTPLQLARAYAILGNGGYEIKPSILKKEKININKGKKIISSQTSKTINSMLRKVVSLDEGTANFANISGYEVGGKTGTSMKYKDKSKKLNTFVSLFPISKPKYVLLVLLDEPKAAPNMVYIINGVKKHGQARNESGWNSVYVAGKIIEKIGPILAIKNLQASNKF